MIELEELGHHVFLGNDLAAWTKAAVQFVLWFTVLPLVKRVVTRKLKKLDPKQSGTALELALDLLERTTRVFLVVVAAYLAIQWLAVPQRLDRWLDGTLLFVVWLQVAMWGTAAIDFFLDRRLKRNAEEAKESAASINILRFVGTAAVWAIAALLLLANLGVDVTALVAGLGVGGIAVALAVQNVLGDLLASLSIALDKPFNVGDFLILGQEMGTVEHIGIKSTRLRSLSGEQIVIANADLLNSRVRNYGRMYERRVAFKIGIVYETPRAQIEAVPGILKAAIEAQDNTRFDRAHFVAFGDFSLNYEAVYHVLDPAYIRYADIQQAINLRIIDEFAARGIAFAYPTSVQYHKDPPGFEPT